MYAATMTTALAASVCVENEKTIGVSGIGIASSGARIRDAREESIERRDEEDGARGHRAAESRHERRPPVRKPSERSVRFAQVDILATSLGAQCCEFCVRHRSHERERTAGHPRQQKPGRVRHSRSNRWGSKENAAADDVGNDDGRCVEGTEPPLEDRS